MQSQSERSLPNYEAFTDSTFGQMLDRLAAEAPDKEALVFGAERVTYSQFRARVRRVAMALKRLGLHKGDRVGVLFPNSLDFFYIQQGILYAGGVFVSLSTRYQKFEIGYMMKHAGARFLLCVDEYLGTSFVDILEEVRPELAEMETIVVKGDRVPSWARRYEEVLRQGDPIDDALLMKDLPAPRDVASILYTSGSTGMPKGAMSSHHALLWNSVRVCERLRIGPDDVFLMMLPCSHIFASLVNFTNAFMGRSKIVIMDNFEPGEALRLQEAEGVSVLYGVPTMFTLMLTHPQFSEFDLTSNRTGYMSGAACPAELVRAVTQKMHNEICIGYGMTEACCITITESSDDTGVKATTAGRPMRDLDVKVADENRREVAQGEVGEIAVRGESVFLGYYKQPELTKQNFDAEGFFYTGDLGRFDENGRLIVVGRKKEMIIRGGFNVYPAEVEEQIALIDGVQHVAVVAIPDPVLGEKVCACVVPIPTHEVRPEQIIQFCKGRLARYKVPDLVEIMDSFPMTTTNKIQKFQIRDRVAKKYGAA